MERRPLGVTILAALMWVTIPWMAFLAVLSLADPKALEGLLRALSPGGSGPANVHLGMGRLVTIYYVAVGASSVAVALGLWRLRNWARLVVLAMVGLSLVGGLASTASLIRGASAGAWALFVLRVGLCVAVGGYLLSTRVRAAFRSEPTDEGTPRASASLRLADRALPWGGLLLVVLGVSGWPAALTAGWAALVLAFFAWVAEWNGIALPRPGRTPVRTLGCWETPLAFTVRHRGAALLFSRDDDPASGAWSGRYTVHERQDGEEFDPRWEVLPLKAKRGWKARGSVPVGSLRFEHRERVSYVETRSLERALASVAA